METNLVTSSYSPEELQLITDTVAKGATQKELQLFLHRCKLLGLNPLKPGQIHFVKYGPGPGTIVVGIDGFRSIAAKTGKMSGVRRGVTFDDKGKLLTAWCEIHRSDWTHPAREEVPFYEYFKPGRNGKPTPWDTMPETMLKKVAEAATLRMAFPDVLGGIYESAEMDQASKNSSQILPINNEEELKGNGTPSIGYKITVGKYAGRSFEEVGPDSISTHLQSMEERAEKASKTIADMGPQWEEYYERGIAFVQSFMKGELQQNES